MMSSFGIMTIKVVNSGQSKLMTQSDEISKGKNPRKVLENNNLTIIEFEQKCG